MNGLKTRIYGLLLLTTLVMAVSVCTAEPPATTKTALVAVIPADFPPTYFRDKNGEPAGLAVDVMNAIARRAGLTVTYRFARPWQEVEELVRNGEADLIPLRVMNETNQQTLLFTTPLDVSYIHYVVRADDLHQKPRPDSKIGVINNSTAEEYLKKQSIKYQLVTYHSLEHMLIDLLSGRIDMLLTVTDNLKSLGERLRLDDRFRIISPAELEVKRGIAVQAGNRQLQERLNKAIESFRGDRESDSIYKKWLGKPVPYWTAKRTALALGSLLILTAVSLIIWHIRALRTSNRKLQAEQTFLQTMIDAIPDFIFFKDRNSVYLGCNNAFADQMHARSKDALIGHDDDDLYKPKELAEQLKRTDREVMESGQLMKFELSVPLKNGNLIRAEVIKVPYRDDTGQIIGVIGIARDISERFQHLQQLEEARDRAEAANHAKSQFLANMSHEIRTPLNGVLGMAQLLAMSNLDHEQQEHLNMIQSSGENLLAILNDILDLAKIEANMLKLVSTAFSPAELLAEVHGFYNQACLQHGVELTQNHSPDLPASVVGDPLRLKQILFNLTGNAVKFTHQGKISLGCSVVSTNPEQIRLSFSVCDTGIGISPLDQERIFKPFEQADNSNTRQYGGTGLGLAICQRLSQAMGGNLTLDSTVGQGSCFSLTLDLKPDLTRACTTVLEENQPLTSRSDRTLAILVAEDNDINRFFLVKLLQQMGHTVLEAENGQQALDLLELQPCDLVLLDIQMPVLDGSQTLQEIRRRDLTLKQHTWLIALTAYAMSGDRDKFLGQGFDDYLPKPLQAGDIESAIQAFLRRKATI